ncbi:carbamoylphosphate synthase large subunit [Bacillaceae bacterium SAS-127]|nr:carbamoylphosphate synthase large subunit [Bacillaceae bacterium SAS-127]
MLKILTEASGSLISAYLIHAIKQSGESAVASDISLNCYAKYLADDFILMPLTNDPNLWSKIEESLIDYEINAVIPSLDETLLGWAERKEYFAKKDINVFVSNPEVIKIFQDKWLTYQFFKENDIPTPKTSLEQDFSLIKPRLGRGSIGVFIASEDIDMYGNISQEFIEGIEYTIDVFCDKKSHPVYIVPRKRINVKDGKSTAGVVVDSPKIIDYVKKICEITHFVGPINIQCIETSDGEIKFIEINPRIAGGMALGFAATENWVKLMVDHFIKGKELEPKEVKYGLKMMRYYSEVFTTE